MDLIRFDDMKRETANRLKTLYEEAFPAEEKSHLTLCGNWSRKGRWKFYL